jgi:hypothetical protein
MPLVLICFVNNRIYGFAVWDPYSCNNHFRRMLDATSQKTHSEIICIQKQNMPFHSYSIKTYFFSYYTWAYFFVEFLYGILISFPVIVITKWIMEWVIVNSAHLHGMFTSLGVQMGDTYIVNSDCLCKYHFTLIMNAYGLFCHIYSFSVNLLTN